MVFGKIISFLRWHYSDVTLRRSEKQIEREKYFLGCVPFNRWMLVPAAVTVQLCIGSLYSWSIYNIPIEKELGLAAGTAANTFYIAVGCFGCSAAIFGPVLERHGPQIMLLISTTLFLLGHILAAVGVWIKAMGLIYFGFGVVGGMGFGISYITPVSPLQKWFPDYKGLLSGLAVCGFGGGSMIASKAENKLIEQQGVALTFIILGCTYAFFMYCCVLVLRCPPPGYYVESPEERRRRREQEVFLAEMGATVAPMATPAAIPSSTTDEIKKGEAGVQGSMLPETSVYDVNGTGAPAIVQLKEPSMKFTLLEALFSSDFRFMYVVLACNSVAGLMIMSKMADIIQQQFGKSKDFASDIVMINSGFNLLGRLGYGAISDRTGQKPIYIVSLAAQAIIMGVLPTLLHEDACWPFIVCIWILATFYGGGFGLIPAFLTAQFGSSNIGALHGVILTAWSAVGVIGGLSFTAIFKNQVHKYEAEGGKSAPNVYDINFYTICGMICFGFFACLLIKTSMRDRLLPRQPGELVRVPFFGRPLIFGYKTRSQQNSEWANYLRTLPENQPGYSDDSEASPTPARSSNTQACEV